MISWGICIGICGGSNVLFLDYFWICLKIIGFFMDDGATLDDVREAVTTLEEIGPTSRRVLGGTHPLTEAIEGQLRNTRDVGAALRDLDEAQVASEEVSG